MNKQSNLRIFILLSILIALVAVSCNLFQREVESEPTDTPTIKETSTPTPTMVPTNDVVLLDNGAPLAPEVMQTDPQGGQELASGGVVAIVFTRPMEQQATEKAFELVDAQGVVVSGDVDWPSPDTFHFIPNSPLAEGQVYHASVSDQAASTEGVSLGEGISFDIVVAGDLQVSQVFPDDGAIDVESNAIITVIFNRPVVPLVIAEQQDDLPQPLQITPQIEGQGEWLSTSVYVFRPTQALASLTTYTVRVEAGLMDTIGSQLPEVFQWQFTTAAPGISSFGLAKPISAINPENNYPNVRPESSFQIDFLQPMNRASVEEAFSLDSFQGERVLVEFDWSTDANVVITPTQDLALGTSYALLLTENALAASGGNLSGGLRWNFQSLPYPAILSTSPGDSSIQSYYSNNFTIYFASPMKLDTIEDRVVFSPEPEGGFSFYFDEWNWSAEFYGLDPSTEYEVKILPGMEDIYGNAISQEMVVSFTTAPYDPSAWLDLPNAPVIYRVSGDQKFYASYVNVDTVDFELYRIPASMFAGFTNWTYDRWNYQPPDENLVNEWHFTNDGRLNKRTRIGVSMETISGDSLSPGFYYLTIDSPQIRHENTLYLDSRILVVASANLTFKLTQTEALIWLTDLDDGTPLSDIPLTVYDRDFSPIGQGTTNSDGLLYLELPEPAQTYDDRFVMTAVDGEPFAFATSGWGSGVSPYDFGIWSDYYTSANQPVGYIYTDRPLYRPGQPVSFKGILRLNDDLAYSLPPWAEIEVSIDSYNENVYQETLPLSEFGSFDGVLQLDENAALGYYTIVARLPGQENSIGGVSFSVAEYRKPEFQVTTTADKTDVLAGEDFTIDILAEYYSGGSVSNTEVSWALSTADYTFQPGGDLSRFTFIDYDRDTGFYNDYFYEPFPQIIAEGQGSTDDLGRMLVTLPADLSESGSSREFTFEATVTDIAGTAVSDRTTIIAHKAEVYPGIRSIGYVGMVGEEQSFELVVVDWDANPVPSHSVDVEIVERRWYSVQEQDAQGYLHWTSSVEEIPVTSFEGVTMDDRGRAMVSFTPERGGIYKAKVTSRDQYGNQSFSGAYLWVSSSDFIPWRQTDDKAIELIADQDEYAPGDVAEILIASPFEGENYVLVTVERGHIRDQDVILMTSNSMLYKLPITADMAPNVYISVVVIKGARSDGVPDFRMGMVQLNVNTEKQALNVKITPDREQAGPGDQVTYTIRVTDMDGQPVSSELSLALADLATLSLSDPNSVPILDYFYNQRSLSVRTAIPIVLSIEHYLPQLEANLSYGYGEGSGGGKGADELGVMDIRQDFPDTAFWQAHIVTDQNGEASVSVTLPDNLTIWRMDARAVTLDTRVGDQLNDLRSTKPLLLRPQTPRFFVVGDQARLGAAVHNNTDETINAVVVLQGEGLTITTDDTLEIEIQPQSQAYVTWEVEIAQEVDRVDLLFAVEGGGYSDATRPTMGTLDDQSIPVYKYEVPETVGTSGMLTEPGSRTEGISLPKEWAVSQGKLTIQVSPSLAAGMTDGLEYLEHYPYECIEQTISRFLPNVLTTQALKAAGLSDPQLEANLSEQVSIALQRLYNWQLADGSWGWWPSSEKGDLLTTAYVVMGLTEAEKAGYSVSANVLTRGINYLRSQLQSLKSLDAQYLLNRQAFVLYVLARAGEPQVSQTVQMYDSRQSLSLYARAYLAESLYIIDPVDSRLKTLLSDFANAAIMSATGTHWEEDWNDYWNWNTDTRTTATILATLVTIDPNNALNPNAVRWLMSNRDSGYWRTTQETAWSLMALTNWMVSSGELEADYDWAVGLNSERLGDGSANTETLRQTRELQADISVLLTEEINRLTIARDEGSGNLYYTAHLEVYLPVEEVEALDRGIIVSRSYFDAGGETPISQASQGDLILARLTVVVPHSLHYIVIDDPLPAGLEAVDPSLQTSPDLTAPQYYDFETLWGKGWGWWYFDHIELRDERVVISANYLPAGTYVYTYLVRASTPGEFRVIPPTAQEFYFPEVYGRGDGSLFVVEP
jgi:uncharacterized protein YfaS (alpha-2-macroglobulin family)